MAKQPLLLKVGGEVWGSPHHWMFEVERRGQWAQDSAAIDLQRQGSIIKRHGRAGPNCMKPAQNLRASELAVENSKEEKAQKQKTHST